ncbi:Nn.00g092090.m01.CDS01 [Neocucurbitaria sp. VM-36]
MENNLSAARQAKRFLDDRIRHDWQYPNVPPAWSASDEEVRDAPEIRERYYGESESGDSNIDEEGATSPYKFDSPDSIGHAVARTREARRKRRKERLERDMAENEGLRIWVERRDIWTGAASVQKYGTKRQRHLDRPPSTAEDSSEEDPTTPTGSESQSFESATPETFDLVPVAPRLLATNPIRASITPKAYSDIFQKIVVSSRTPSVPINLADMTKALVQGWKDTDEWPPRPGILDPLAGKKRGITGAAVNAHHGGFMERHPHLEKSVDSVKRILHLNGHHPDQEDVVGEKEG